MPLKPKPTEIFREITTYTTGHHSVRTTYNRKLWDGWRSHDKTSYSFVTSVEYLEGAITWEEASDGI